MTGRALFRVVSVSAEDTLDLRRAVLRGGRTDLPLDDDPSARHLAVRDDEGTLVATGNVRPDPAEWAPDVAAWRIRGMATDPSYRGTGAGGAILEALVGLAADEGAALVWCHARTRARRFYERHGFGARGEEWVEPPPLGPHVVMERDLSGQAGQWLLPRSVLRADRVD